MCYEEIKTNWTPLNPFWKNTILHTVTLRVVLTKDTAIVLEIQVA